jgi:hypothetical protein
VPGARSAGALGAGCTSVTGMDATAGPPGIAAGAGAALAAVGAED